MMLYYHFVSCPWTMTRDRVKLTCYDYHFVSCMEVMVRDRVKLSLSCDVMIIILCHVSGSHG